MNFGLTIRNAQARRQKRLIPYLIRKFARIPRFRALTCNFVRSKQTPITGESMFKAILLILSFVSIQAFATTNNFECNRTFISDIGQCAQGLRFLGPRVRAAAIKACVKDAKIERTECLGGGSGGPDTTCLANCQAVYDATVVSCNTTYDPAQCGGSISCESQITNMRSACISTAVSDLNTCNLTCQ